MVVIVTCSPTGIQATIRYYSMFQRKFSKSLVFHAPPKGLGSGTRTFVGRGYEADGDPCTIACFISMIFPSRDLVCYWNSLVIASTLSRRDSIQRLSYASPSNLVASQATRRFQPTEWRGWCLPLWLYPIPHPT